MTRLTFECDPEPYGKERDGAIIKMAQEFGVETIIRNSHTLYNLDRFVSHNHVTSTSSYRRSYVSKPSLTKLSEIVDVEGGFQVGL